MAASSPTAMVFSSPSTVTWAAWAPLPRVRAFPSPARASSPRTSVPVRVRSAPLVPTSRSPSRVEPVTVRVASPALGVTSTPPVTLASSTVTPSAATSRMPSTSPVTWAFF